MLNKFICVGVFLIMFLYARADSASPSVKMELVVEKSMVLEKGKSMGVSIARLWFYNEVGVKMPTSMAYLILSREGEPVIEDKIEDGYQAEIRVVPGGQGKIVAILFFAGGNQYALRLYTFTGDRLIAFKRQPVGSNMRSIELEGGLVRVANQSANEAGERIVIFDQYNIEGGDCVPVGVGR